VDAPFPISAVRISAVPSVQKNALTAFFGYNFHLQICQRRNHSRFIRKGNALLRAEQRNRTVHRARIHINNAQSLGNHLRNGAFS